MINDSVSNVPSKVFLRQKQRLYYTHQGGWTPHQENARDFEDAAGALVFARAADLPGLEIVIVTGDGESSLRISG
jgi:hypothetical protein